MQTQQNQKPSIILYLCVLYPRMGCKTEKKNIQPKNVVFIPNSRRRKNKRPSLHLTPERFSLPFTLNAPRYTSFWRSAAGTFGSGDDYSLGSLVALLDKVVEPMP